MKKAIVLLSGGMDSSALLHLVKKQLGAGAIHALSFNYGQKHSRELAMARWQAKAAAVKDHCTVNASFLKTLFAGGSALTDSRIAVPDLAELSASQLDQPPTYVPNRNMILLALAAAYAESKGIEDVFYGAHAQDQYGYWDCTRKFIHNINRVLSLNRRKPVTIHAPFIGMKKIEILKAGLRLGVDFSRTWSCYRGGRRPCGKCPTCVDRLAAFLQAGIEDPLARS